MPAVTHGSAGRELALADARQVTYLQ